MKWIFPFKACDGMTLRNENSNVDLKHLGQKPYSRSMMLEIVSFQRDIKTDHLLCFEDE